MRVAGQATTAGRAAVLLTETVHVRLRQASLKEGASVHTGRGVTLEVDLVTAVRVVLAAPEVLQAHLIQGCRRGIAGDVPTDANAGTLLTMHLDGGVPAQHVTDVLLKVYVTRVGNLTGLGDGVDVVCRNQRRHSDVLVAGPFVQLQHHEPRAVASPGFDQAVQRFQPLIGFFRISVGKVGR